MKHIIIITSLFAVLGTASINAQCAHRVDLVAGIHVAPPTGFDKVSLVDLGGGTPVQLSLTNGEFVADTLAFPAMQAFRDQSPDASKLVLRWAKIADATSKCDQPITVPPGNGDTSPTTHSSDADMYQACEDAAKTKEVRIKKLVGDDAFTNGHYTLIILHPELGVCYASRQFGVQGEPIVTGIFTDSTFQLPRLKLDPCSPRPAGPRFVPGGAITAPSVQATGFELSLPRADVCYDDSVTITLSSKKANPVDSTKPTDVAVTQTLKQYPRYHATLQLAALLTDNQQRSFGLRPGPNSTSLITDEGPVDEGPEYYAAVMIYGAPHYLRQLFSGQSYDGRELTNENGPLDRTSLVLGAGLTKPGTRIGAGLSYEIIRGINVIAMYERARLSSLNGVNVGDVFAGTKDLIPTRKSWNEQIVFGIGLDARYAMAIFTGKQP